MVGRGSAEDHIRTLAAIQREIRPIPSTEHVGTAAAYQFVGAVPSIKHIGTTPPSNDVTTTETADHVGTRCPFQPIAVVGAPNGAAVRTRRYRIDPDAGYERGQRNNRSQSPDAHTRATDH